MEIELFVYDRSWLRASCVDGATALPARRSHTGTIFKLEVCLTALEKVPPQPHLRPARGKRRQY
ncbi:MAG TPA: hypothetical protein PLD20_30910 [Blastocatellia bacterium]|nr:hypothetical protein [Blastocatellia bacterium]HMX24325.1 hypothetical protein [Blastocatellia bacterium]HMY72619.1 hypothetical protein [Blastocatellia bacterium]HMZ22382.1 hypothetical protein [Blastocatellia bacterium]HNG33121.1 hypothetical protein [Blastocatellia bacterium]